MSEKLKSYIAELKKNEIPENLHALALFSGGLDSVLAAYLIAKQGIKVTALHFDTGFLSGNHKEKVENWQKMYPEINFEYVDISDEYIEMLNNPEYGYGSAMNPCIDCHLFMLRKAVELMVSKQAHFIVTGEVKGQRPKSQNVRAMAKIEEQSQIKGFLLRPLSAKIMDATIPEQKGWVDRENLMGINGRNREQQLQLAKDFELTVDLKPGSDACNLLESPLSVKYFDFLLNNKNRKPTEQDFELFKLGRHFRISKNVKIIVGRNKNENQKLYKAQQNHYLLNAHGIKSPIGLLEFDEKPSADDFKIAAEIIAVYSDTLENSEVQVSFSHKTQDGFELKVKAPKMEEIYDHKLIGISKSRKKTDTPPFASKAAKIYKGEINRNF